MLTTTHNFFLTISTTNAVGPEKLNEGGWLRSGLKSGSGAADDLGPLSFDSGDESLRNMSSDLSFRATPDDVMRLFCRADAHFCAIPLPNRRISPSWLLAFHTSGFLTTGFLEKSKPKKCLETQDKQHGFTSLASGAKKANTQNPHPKAGKSHSNLFEKANCS